VVRDEDFRREAADAEQGDIEQRGATDQKAERIAHGRDIGGDIERVRNQQKPDHGIQQDRRHRLADIGCQTLAGHGADTGADHLDGNHERRGQEHGPAERVAELGAAL
jgi:hypothetical protein